MNPGSCCFTLMRGLGYGENHECMYASIPCCVSTLQAGGGVGCVFMAHIGLFYKSGATSECHRISEHHCQSGASIHCRIMPHTTRLGLSRNGSTNIREISLLQWPAQSPDMPAVAYVWFNFTVWCLRGLKTVVQNA
jgi:hypothetical protein